MRLIPIADNKILKLMKVLSVDINQLDVVKQQKTFAMIENWIKLNNLRRIGPIVIYSSGIIDTDDCGKPIIKSKLFIQLNAVPDKIDIPYSFTNELKIQNCLYSHFDGESQMVQHASNKLLLMAYENDIELTGDTYTVMLEEKDNNLKVDIFMPKKDNV